MRVERFLWVILGGLLAGLLWLIADDDIVYPGTLHCGRNDNTYITCNGEDEIDYLIKEYNLTPNN